MPLAYYVHHLSPFIVRINESFGIRWYGFAYMMGFLVAYLLLQREAKSRDGLLRIPTERVPDMVMACCIFGVLVGGRLGYCLFYDHSLLGFSSQFPYWGVLKVWQGGMSAHGGVLFTVLTLIIWCKKNKYSITNVGDAACMVVPCGLCFGRIANFINGELYGHVTDVAWAVKFPSELISPTNGQYTLSPETRYGLIDAVIKQFPNDEHLGAIRNMAENGNGDWYYQAMSRIMELAQAGNTFVLEKFNEVLPARHPSQLYEALLEGVALFVMVWVIARIWRKDGMASGAFLTLYPVMRIAGEQFRIGDTPIMILGVPVSKGILYSIPMFVIGLAYWVIMARRPGNNIKSSQEKQPA